jgi:phosphoribosylamine--glycine ligase/phosphoribosylformylglycinamidine cyclo-ligase
MDDRITESLKILLVGNGGREHALAWKLSQSPLVKHIYVVPGNGGTERLGESVSNIYDVAVDDYPGLVQRSYQLGIGLVVVGPDQAVVDGIEGYFRESKFAGWMHNGDFADPDSPRWYTLLRTEQAGCRSGRLQGFCQGIYAKAWNSHR